MATTPIGTAGTLAKTDYVNFLKEFYQGVVVADLVYKNHPWLGIVPKNPNVRGNVYVKPVRYANITGQSALYATAHENQGPASRERWELNHIDNYAKATVSNKVMELSIGDPAAFRQALTDAVDSAHSAFANDVHFELLASHAKGARALIADWGDAVAGDTTIDDGVDLTVQLGAGEARFFEVGMLISHSAAAQATILDSDETVAVKGVDRANDTITIDNWTTTDIATGQYLYRSGDFGIKADSVPTWLPGSGVGATSFNGVVRTLDPTRLAGVDAVVGTSSTRPYTEALIKTGAALYNQGSTPDIALLNPTDVAGLSFELESQATRYMKVGATSGSVGYSALSVMTGAGEVGVVADPALKPQSLAMGARSEFELFSAGGLPRMFNKDGNFYHREEAADTLAFYLFGFYNQCIQAPVTWAYGSDIYNPS